MIAVTLPDEIIRGLKRVDSDLAWAIVRLLRTNPKANGRAPIDSGLVSVAGSRSLIVVNRNVFKALPGVQLVPLDDDRAFLALEREASAADLELAIVDRLSRRSLGGRERAALAELRDNLRRWRRNPTLRCRTRSIIVVERAK